MSGRGGTQQGQMSLAAKMEKGDIIDLVDVTCPICLCILLEPVEMPCTHTICTPCFNDILAHANICCPICRARLSTWCRRATKQNTLVSYKLWNYIKDKFGDEVKKRELGEDGVDVDEIFPCVPNHIFAEKGEIKVEFEAVMRREEAERAAREEEEKSIQLIRQLQAEEAQQANQTLKDEEYARQVFNTPSPGKENRHKPLRKKTGPLDSFLASQSPKPSPGTPRSTDTSKSVTGSQNTPDTVLQSRRVVAPATATSQTPKALRAKTLFSPNNITTFMKQNGIRGKCETITSKDSTNEVNEEQDMTTSEKPSSPALDLASIIETVDEVPANRLVKKRQVLEIDDFETQSLENDSGDESQNLLQDQDLSELYNSNESLTSLRSLESSNLMDSPQSLLSPPESQSLLGDQDCRQTPKARETARFSKSLTEKTESSVNHLGTEDPDDPSADDLFDSSGVDPDPTVDFLYSVDGVDEALLEEQRRIVQEIEQEKRDHEVALRIQQQLDKELRFVDRRKGSADEYSLRGTPVSTKKRSRNNSKEGRQMSIQESFKKSKLSHSQEF